MTNNNYFNSLTSLKSQVFYYFGLWVSFHNNLWTTFFRHHYMFRTHPDINTARMTFNHQLSIEWQVCTPPHFNLQYTQHGQIKLR
jgi:hypothetical protein